MPTPNHNVAKRISSADAVAVAASRPSSLWLSATREASVAPRPPGVAITAPRTVLMLKMNTDVSAVWIPTARGSAPPAVMPSSTR